METATLLLEDIKPAGYNPRKALKPGDEEYERLKNSITEFGFVEPLIVNERNMVLVGGHQRYTVLKDLGYKETEAVLVNLDENEEKTLNVALNKIEGDWDIEKLQSVLSELSVDDIIRTSFGQIEIDDIMQSLQESQETLTVEEQNDEPEEAEHETTEEPEEKPFEIYLSFNTQEQAEAWLKDNGIDQKFDESRSIVITYEGVETDESR